MVKTKVFRKDNKKKSNKKSKRKSSRNTKTRHMNNKHKDVSLHSAVNILRKYFRYKLNNKHT